MRTATKPSVSWPGACYQFDVAHPDLDRLMNFCVPFAQQRLAEDGRFHPFAATLHSSGEITPQATYTGEEHPEVHELVKDYTHLLKNIASRGEASAAALCFDYCLPITGEPSADRAKKKDAIAIGLEHCNGESVTVYLPYSKLAEGYAYDPIIAVARAREFFD